MTDSNKSVRLFALVMLLLASVAIACTHYGPYECDNDCDPDTPLDIDTIQFIRTAVNLDANSWGPCDTVEIVGSDGGAGLWGRGSALSPHEFIAPLPTRVMPCLLCLPKDNYGWIIPY